jgi:Arc/MetJ-type ribon-helix-helix transcriptional regulator
MQKALCLAKITSAYRSTETLTRFWSETIRAFVSRGDFPNAYAAVREAVNEYGNNRDLHRLFYDYDIVSDSNARREWIRPNQVR